MSNLTIQAVYEKYQHIDHLLIDRDWLPDDYVGAILFDLWQAIRNSQIAPLAGKLYWISGTSVLASGGTSGLPPGVAAGRRCGRETTNITST